MWGLGFRHWGPGVMLGDLLEGVNFAGSGFSSLCSLRVCLKS